MPNIARSVRDNARKATGVLAERSDHVVRLIHDSNALLTELRAQSARLDQLSGNIAEMARQIRELIATNRDTLKPALEKLNGVLAIVDNRKAQVQKSIKGLVPMVDYLCASLDLEF